MIGNDCRRRFARGAARSSEMQAKGQGKEQARVRRLKCGSESERQCKLLELGVLGADGEVDEGLRGSNESEINILGVPF
jgi:hypothetical protein